MPSFFIQKTIPIPSLGIIAIWGFSNSIPWWGSVAINIPAREAHIRVTVPQATPDQAVGTLSVSLSFTLGSAPLDTPPIPTNSDILFSSCVHALHDSLLPHLQSAVLTVIDSLRTTPPPQ